MSAAPSAPASNPDRDRDAELLESSAAGAPSSDGAAAGASGSGGASGGSGDHSGRGGAVNGLSSKRLAVARQESWSTEDEAAAAAGAGAGSGALSPRSGGLQVVSGLSKRVNTEAMIKVRRGGGAALGVCCFCVCCNATLRVAQAPQRN